MKLVLNLNPSPLKRFRFTKTGKTYNSQSSLMEDVSFFIKIQYEKHLCVDRSSFKDGPISIDITFFMLIAKYHTKTKKDGLKGTYHLIKPDLDNLVKFLLDCITLSGIITDDSQFVIINARKVWSLKARTEFEIKNVDLEYVGE